MSSSTMKEARLLVADLFEPKASRYWTDFLVTMAIGYTAGAVTITMTQLPVAIRATTFVTAISAIYRLSLFMHEICHLGRDQMRGFKITWNLLVGIPLLFPSFFYESHREHHNTRHYGTENDGEYLPLALGSWKDIALYFAQVFYLPFLTFFRHLIVTPISFLHPRLRRWTLEHWSSFVINLKHRREIRPQDPVGWWAVIELACHLRAVVLVIAIITGLRTVPELVIVYSMAVSVLSLNYIRTLGAHRYRSAGLPISLAAQVDDSVDIASRDWITLILCPVGLRFHALHHMFPGMPYHHLETAHRRLREKLPSDHAYHRCIYPSLWTSIGELFREIASHRHKVETNPSESRSNHRAAR